VREDNRKHPRKAVEAAVAFQIGEGPRVDARCRDVSLGGMFIETTPPLPYGAKLRIYLPLPGLDAGIECVVRWAKPDGMGVQFGVMGARETHALTRLLAG
jgi:type IV pilus assembly protein PilZ